jgi:hypothetical protein
MVWVWQHGKGTDDYKIILNLGRKLMKINEEEAERRPKFF